MSRECLALTLTLALALFSLRSGADPSSDLFQPDVQRTGAALTGRTHTLHDPLGSDCALPGGAVPATGLSLSAAVNLALCRNPATRSSWAAAREQAALLGQAESAWLPTVSATGSQSRVYGEHADVTGLVDSAPQNNRDAAVNLSWTLYDFGGRGGRIRNARSLLDAAAAGLDSVSQQTVVGVVQDYFGVVAGDATLLAARATESTGAKSLDIARSLHAGGVATQGDVLQAETAYDQAVLARVQAQAAAASAHGALAVEIGSPADQPLTLAADPVPAQVPSLTARMSDLMAEAARQRPDLAAALAQRDAAQANVTVARAVGRPSISFQAGRNLADTVGIANQNYNQVGLYITVPIFNGFNTAYGVRQAQALVEASEVGVEQARLTVSLGVWNAYYALDSANEQLAATATLTRVSDDNQQVALGRYQSGVGTILDVLTAQSAAANARLLRINAELGWQVARAQFALALGRLSGSQPLSGMDLP